MADAAYVLVNVDMHNYLRDTIEVNNGLLRVALMRGGFREPATLAKKSKEFIADLCYSIRRGPGVAAARNVTAEQEENMQKFRLWCTYNVLVQRPLEYVNATQDAIDSVWEWADQLQDSPKMSTVPGFTDGGDKRVWFEAIVNWCSMMKGKSGFPILYTIRKLTTLPLVDPGFGQPDFATELSNRGRHSGFWWNGDKALLWSLCWCLCHGTNGWHAISTYLPTTQGRSAYLALLGTYMGADVSQVLLRRAEEFLTRASFDGRSKNFTFDKFIGKLRQAFNDLGEENQMSERRKVEKLVSAFQVPNLQHLDAMVTGDPARANNFEVAVTFIAGQMATQRNKNVTGHSRGLAEVDTGFNVNNPGKYLSQRVWKGLNEEERAAVWKARRDRDQEQREAPERSGTDTEGTSDSAGESEPEADNESEPEADSESEPEADSEPEPEAEESTKNNKRKSRKREVSGISTDQWLNCDSGSESNSESSTDSDTESGDESEDSGDESEDQNKRTRRV